MLRFSDYSGVFSGVKKGRLFERSECLPFLTPEETPALDVGKTRPGGHAGGTV